MTRAADAIESVLSRPRLLAPILGVVAAAGFQPLGLWPLSLIALGVFLHLIERAPTWRRAALLGWLFGSGDDDDNAPPPPPRSDR